jgi:putative oxidoreductase
MNTFGKTGELSGRILLALIFVASGFGKIPGYAGTQAYMEAMGVQGALLPLVIATELGGGVLLALGLWTRLSAVALAGFTLLAAVLFHRDFADQMQMIMFMKNLAISGGLFVVFAHGAGPWSVDARRGRS